MRGVISCVLLLLLALLHIDGGVFAATARVACEYRKEVPSVVIPVSVDVQTVNVLADLSPYDAILWEFSSEALKVDVAYTVFGVHESDISTVTVTSKLVSNELQIKFASTTPLDRDNQCRSILVRVTVPRSVLVLCRNTDECQTHTHGHSISVTEPFYTRPHGVEWDNFRSIFSNIRRGVFWDKIENKTYGGPGVYNFTENDDLYQQLFGSNITIMSPVHYGNPLYTQNGYAPSNDYDHEAFANWTLATIHKYEGRGIFWELWNEPDLGSWTPGPNATNYAALCASLGKTIKAKFPGEKYVAPAVSWISSTEEMPLHLMETAFQAGCIDYLDGITVHAYRTYAPPESAAGGYFTDDGSYSAKLDFQRVRMLIREYAPAGKHIPILISEFGYSRIAGWHSVANFPDPERAQAFYAVRSQIYNMANDIPQTYWYTWTMTSMSDPYEANFGMFDRALGTYKLEFNATLFMAKMIKELGFSKEIFVSSTTTASQIDYVYLFTNLTVSATSSSFVEGSTVIVAWAQSNVTRKIEIPIGKSQTVKIYSMFGSMTTATSNPTTGYLTVPVFNEPIYIVPTGAFSDYLKLLIALQRTPPTTKFCMPGIVNSIPVTIYNPLTRDVSVKLTSNHTTNDDVSSVPPKESLILHDNIDCKQGWIITSFILDGITTAFRTYQRIETRFTIAPNGYLSPTSVSFKVARKYALHQFDGTIVVGNRVGVTTTSTAVKFLPGSTDTDITIDISQHASSFSLSLALYDSSTGKLTAHFPLSTFYPLPEASKLSTLDLTRLNGNKGELSSPKLDPDGHFMGSPFKNLPVIEYNYEFAHKDYVYIESKLNTQYATQKGGFQMAMWVYAAKPTNSYLNARIVDAKGKEWQDPDNEILSWSGWDSAIFKIGHSDSFIPDKDGNLASPIKFSLFIFNIGDDSLLFKNLSIYFAGPVVYITHDSLSRVPLNIDTAPFSENQLYSNKIKIN